ncbi:MAG: hypothetical protein NDJ90_12325 [Oligoflexia bacterium]|nr:hypothetical protein [Oligoflexia bacterium]
MGAVAFVLTLAFAFGGLAAPAFGAPKATEPLVTSCDLSAYQEPEWAFLRAIAGSKLKTEDKLAAVRNACGEFDLKTAYGSFAQSRKTSRTYVLSVVWKLFQGMGFGSASFTRLGGSEAQAKFKAELERIKSEPDPVLRIQRVYELVSRSQGEYDPERGFTPYRLPGPLLDRAKKKEIGGQCRDFALLMYWSLVQVARYPQNEPMSRLNRNSFSMEVAYGDGHVETGDYVGFHEWVRVNLPVYVEPGKPIRFEQFDVDTTWYPGTFSPVMARTQNLSPDELAEKQARCQEMQACLSVKNIEESLRTLSLVVKSSNCQR